MQDEQGTEIAGLHIRPRKRLAVWLALGAWAVAAYLIGGWAAQDMRFRVNDLGAIPGAGTIMRDADGVFYHVNTQRKARAIYPSLDPPGYTDECLDCSIVTGEQLAQTQDFCVSSTPAELPELRFEVPCQTWGPIDEAQKIAGFVVFITPLLIGWAAGAVLRRIARA